MTRVNWSWAHLGLTRLQFSFRTGVLIRISRSLWKHFGLFFLLKCKSLDGDLQDVQRTHVVKISLLFLPNRSFSLWHDNSFLWWSQTRVLLVSCLLVWISVVKSYKYDKRNQTVFNVLIKWGGSKEFWNAEFIFDGYAETFQEKTVLVLRQVAKSLKNMRQFLCDKHKYEEKRGNIPIYSAVSH